MNLRQTEVTELPIRLGRIVLSLPQSARNVAFWIGNFGSSESFTVGNDAGNRINGIYRQHKKNQAWEPT